MKGGMDSISSSMQHEVSVATGLVELQHTVVGCALHHHNSLPEQQPPPPNTQGLRPHTHTHSIDQLVPCIAGRTA